MSQAGGPKGQSLGIWECVAKEGRTVRFRNEEGEGVAFTLTEEEVEYFSTGQHYELLATRP